MFYMYKVVGNTLYLYVDDKCEIGSFFGNDKDNLIYKIKKYIHDMKIKFDGTKVVLILSGLMLGTVYLSNNFKPNDYDVYKDNKYVYNIVDTAHPDIKKDIENQEEKAEIKEEQKVDVQKQTPVKQNNKSVIIQKSEYDTSNQTYRKTPEKEIVTNTSNEKTVEVRRSNGQVLNIDLEEYLIGVIAAEMPASFEMEALKAQSIVARTYTKKLLNGGRTLTDTVSTQVYKDNDQLKAMWGSSYNTYYNKIRNAVLSTKDLYITYNGSVIDAVYHSTSNGYTEDPINVWGYSFPYLKTVSSPWDTSASSFLRQTDLSYLELSDKLGFDFNNDTILEIISRDDSNRILKIQIGNNEYSGVQLRNMLGLRSADFDIDRNESSITFTTRGYGHGVGMSQYGANGMAKSGYTYDKILKHYYSDVQIEAL